MAGLAEANNWREFYLTFLRYGLILKVSGNGLDILDRYVLGFMINIPPRPADWIGASRKAKLEAVFGQFLEPELDLFQTQPDETYTAIPLHLGFYRDNLYTEFKPEMAKRKASF